MLKGSVAMYFRVPQEKYSDGIICVQLTDV